MGLLHEVPRGSCGRLRRLFVADGSDRAAGGVAAADRVGDAVSAPVQRIHTGRGSRIEPPLDQSWSPLEKLRWHLAVALHDAEMPPDLFMVEEEDAPAWGGRRYAVRWACGGMSSMSYDRMWTLINGISLGLEKARR